MGNPREQADKTIKLSLILAIGQRIPIETTLQAPGSEGRLLPVRVESRVTELGTLALEAAERDGARKWKLEFNARQRRRSASPEYSRPVAR
jgi:hypothetical protein